MGVSWPASVAVVLLCSVWASPSDFTNLDSDFGWDGPASSCRSSVSLCCSDPLGTEGMDP